MDFEAKVAQLRGKLIAIGLDEKYVDQLIDSLEEDAGDVRNQILNHCADEQGYWKLLQYTAAKLEATINW